MYNKDIVDEQLFRDWIVEMIMNNKCWVSLKIKAFVMQGKSIPYS